MALKIIFLFWTEWRRLKTHLRLAARLRCGCRGRRRSRCWQSSCGATRRVARARGGCRGRRQAVDRWSWQLYGCRAPWWRRGSTAGPSGAFSVRGLEWVPRGRPCLVPGKYVTVMGVVHACSPQPCLQAVKLTGLSDNPVHQRMWQLEWRIRTGIYPRWCRRRPGMIRVLLTSDFAHVTQGPLLEGPWDNGFGGPRVGCRTFKR
jgi:hypothetical protein